MASEGGGNDGPPKNTENDDGKDTSNDQGDPKDTSNKGKNGQPPAVTTVTTGGDGDADAKRLDELKKFASEEEKIIKPDQDYTGMGWSVDPDKDNLTDFVQEMIVPKNQLELLAFIRKARCYPWPCVLNMDAIGHSERAAYIMVRAPPTSWKWLTRLVPARIKRMAKDYQRRYNGLLPREGAVSGDAIKVKNWYRIFAKEDGINSDGEQQDDDIVNIKQSGSNKRSFESMSNNNNNDNNIGNKNDINDKDNT